MSSAAADLVALSLASAAAADGGGASSSAAVLPETLDFPSPFWPSPPDASSLDYFVSVFSPLRPDFPDSDSDFDDPVNLFADLRTPPTPVPDYLGLAGLVGSGFETDSADSGLRMIGFDSDSDTDDELIPAPVASGGAGAGAGAGGRGCGSTSPDHDVCWDCFRIDNPVPDMTEDFEWEEVDGRLDDRALLSMMVGEGGEETDVLNVSYPDLDHGIGRSNVEWEVLLAGDNLSVSMDHFMDPVEAEEDAELYYRNDFEFDASEYEFMFGQLPESSLRGSPPAAKSVVAGLKSIVLTEDDVAKNNTVCAVCKDEISLKETVKQLPCLHHYHGDCIVPWLGMRNTCPVCRYELPTEDPDYENSRARRAGGAGAVVSRQV